MDKALFLDFDGTLVEIAARPELVRVEPALPATLARLRDRLGGALALVSGRSVATLDGFLAPERFDAIGLHGLERRIGDDFRPCRPELHPALRGLVDRLGIEAPAGVLIEDKGCSVALHWRSHPELAGAAVEIVERAARKLGPDYRVQAGKAVLEILPATAGKGEAIRACLAEPAYRDRQPIFIGDDRTDEDGFAVIQDLGGVAIKVGAGPSLAPWRLASPRKVRDWLAAWAASGDVPVIPQG